MLLWKNFVNEWIVYGGDLLLLLSFIWAFQLRKNKNAPTYFRFFYCIPLVRVLRSGFTILYVFDIWKKNEMAFCQNLCIILEFLIVAWLFFNLHKKKPPKRFVAIVFFITAIGAGYLFSTNYIDQSFFHLNAFFNFSIFLFCLHYYGQLLKNYGVVHLSKDPAFWIVLGLFIFSTVNLPLYAIHNFVKTNYGLWSVSFIMDAINIIVIVEHLLFFKAYRCAPHYSAEPAAEADDFPPLDIS